MLVIFRWVWHSLRPRMRTYTIYVYMPQTTQNINESSAISPSLCLYLPIDCCVLAAVHIDCENMYVLCAQNFHLKMEKECIILKNWNNPKWATHTQTHTPINTIWCCFEFWLAQKCNLMHYADAIETVKVQRYTIQNHQIYEQSNERVFVRDRESFIHTTLALIKSHHQNIKSPNYSHIILPHSVWAYVHFECVCATPNRYDGSENSMCDRIYGDCGYDICQWFITTKRNHSIFFLTHTHSDSLSTLTIHCRWLSDPSVSDELNFWLLLFAVHRKMLRFFARTYLFCIVLYSHCVYSICLCVSLSICSEHHTHIPSVRLHCERDRFSLTLLPVIWSSTLLTCYCSSHW